MILRNRAFFVLLAGVSAALIGCGGGGGGSSPTPVHATATPTTAATPTPTPSPTPIATADAPTVYVGNSLATKTNYESSPNPVSTAAVTIERGVTDEGPATFNGAATEDIQTVDEDVQASQIVTVTTNSYVSQPAAAPTTVLDYGYTSSDTTGQKIVDTVTGPGSANGQIDQLPETAGATWTNNGANALDQSESDGTTIARTTAAGGSFSETDTTPQSSQVAPTPSPLVATAVANADGSGTYSFYLGGEAYGLSTFAYAAPSGGNVTITVTLSAAAAAATGTNTITYVVPTWFTTPLYVETVVDNGPQSVPPACDVPAAYGTSGYQIVRSITNTDPIFGSIETATETDYKVNDFDVCSVLASTTKTYYDFSGQSGQGPLGIGFATTTAPLEIATVASTIGLQKTDVSSAVARRHEIARMHAAAVSFRVTLERARLKRRHEALLHLRSLVLGRIHR